MGIVSRRTALAGLASAAVIRPSAARTDPLALLWQGIDLQGPDGRTFQMRDLRRKVVLIKLWANWCPACIGELASLTALADALDRSSVEVVMVSHPEFWARDQHAAVQRRVPFRLATLAPSTLPTVASAALLDANGAYTVPRTMAFRSSAAELWAHLGAVSWSSPDTLARLRSWTA